MLMAQTRNLMKYKFAYMAKNLQDVDETGKHETIGKFCRLNSLFYAKNFGQFQNFRGI